MKLFKTTGKLICKDKKASTMAELLNNTPSNVDLSFADLRNRDLSNISLSFRKLNNANFSGSNLSGAVLIDTELQGTYFSGTNLTKARLDGSDIGIANFKNAILNEASLNNTKADSTIFKGADLTNMDCRFSRFSYCNLEGANLFNVDFSNSSLIGINYSGAEGLTDPINFIKDNFKCTKKGVIVYKTFGKSYPPNKNWHIIKNSVIAENVDFDIFNPCGCGINVATKDWVNTHYREGLMWKLLVKNEWLINAVVPYKSIGKFRVGRAKLLKIIKR